MKPAANRSARVRNRAEFEKLTQRQKTIRTRVLEALSAARIQGLPLSKAAREAGTTVKTILRYADSAVERLASGRYRVLQNDSLYRRLQVISTEGLVQVDVRGLLEARLASDHANAIRDYGLSGDESVLDRFRGARVGGVALETDVLRLAALAAAGELDEFQFYAASTS